VRVKNGLDPGVEDSSHDNFFRSAVKYGTYDVVKACVDVGAELEDVSLVKWSMRDNVFPEGGEADDYAKKFRARLDAGAEVLVRSSRSYWTRGRI
jgi:hypothetical protein